MPKNNYNYGADYIMNSDKVGVDKKMGEDQLTRMPADFDTKVDQGKLVEDAGKSGKGKNAEVDASILNADKDRDY